MKKNVLLVLCSFIVVGAIGQSTIKGYLVDEETREPILFGNVAVYQKGEIVTGIETDFDGYFEIKDVAEGCYDLEFSYVGYQDSRVVNYCISNVEKVDTFEIDGNGVVELEEIVIICYSYSTSCYVWNKPRQAIGDQSFYQGNWPTRFRLSGQLKDLDTEEVLANLTVKIKGTSFSAQTDETGRFELASYTDHPKLLVELPKDQEIHLGESLKILVKEEEALSVEEVRLRQRVK